MIPVADIIADSRALRAPARGRLGQTAPAVGASQPDWTAYFQGVRDAMVGSWNTARAAYLSLKQIRESLGLPFLAPGGEAQSVGALSSGENQSMLELAEFVKTLTGFMDEALANKRRIIYDQRFAGFLIEGLAGDARRVDWANDRPVLIDIQSGQPVRVDPQGTLGAIPVIAWVGIAAAGAAAIATPVAAYFAVKSACELMESLAQNKTQQTLATKGYDCIEAGKCTPEQATALSTGVLKSSAELREAEAEKERAKGESTSDISKAVTTIAFVALGIGVIYLAAQLIPTLARQTAKAA